jgi:hypothetical protein
MSGSSAQFVSISLFLYAVLFFQVANILSGTDRMRQLLRKKLLGRLLTGKGAAH